MTTGETEGVRRRNVGDDSGISDPTATTTAPTPDATTTPNNSNNTFTLPATFAYESSTDYARCMELWYAQCQWAQFMHMNTMMMSTQMQMLNSGMMPNMVLQQSAAPTAPQAPPPTPIVNRLIQPASFLKRCVAEGIDFVLCFMIKLLVVYWLVGEEIIDLGRFDKLMNYESDLRELIDITQELFPIEILTKVIVAVLEALMIWSGFPGLRPGCTPGKLVMGIKVVCVDNITARNQAEIMGHNVRPVRFWQSMCRSMLKNLSVGFLFPVCMIQYAFPYNRGLYDLATGSVVIEA